MRPEIARGPRRPQPQGAAQRPPAEWDHPAFSVYGTGKRLGVAVRTEKYRYVEYDGGKEGAMLFDVIADPSESRNLIDDPKLAKVRESLAALARQHAAGAR